MAAPDVSMKPLRVAAGAVVLIVALTIAVVFGLLRLWHSPAGGTPLHAARGAAALAAAGPALQSAPQIEGDAYRRAKARALAASEAGR
jgi:hypothetical protein